jgi:type I restriction enzyme S subunit
MRKYKTYEKYKSSSMEWLDEIPNHWRMVRLKFGYEACLGKMLTSSPSSPEDTLEPYLRSANILWGNVDISDIKEMYFSPYEKEIYSLKPGDLVASEGGDVGRAAIWNGEIENCYIQNAVHRIRSKDGFLNKFLYYWLFFLKAAGYVDLLCSKATIAHLTLDKLRELPVYNPPIAEQKQIARFLDRETTRIDTLITKKRQLIAFLQKKRDAIIYQATTRGIDINVPMQDSGIPWIGKIPKHWNILQFKWMSILQRGVDITKDNQIEGDVPVVSFGGISSYHNVPIAKAPGVIIGRKGTLGKVYYLDRDYWAHDTTLYVSEFYENHPKFVYYKLQSMELENWDTGSANPTLNRNLIHPLKVSLPSKSEQTSIADFLDAETQNIDQVIDKVQLSIVFFEKYRQSLVTAAVTGKIDLREEVN